MSSKSHGSKHGSTCTTTSGGSLSSIEHNKCVYRACRSCKVYHCDSTPCRRFESANAGRRIDFEKNGKMSFRQDSNPICSWCFMQHDGMPRFNRVSYLDVTHRVHEEDIHIDREDINERSCRRGRVFNVCRAYVGEEDERVAVKWVREGHECEKDHYWEAIKQAKESAKIVRAFMNETDTNGWKVRVLIPQKAKGWLRRNGHHTTVIVEPYLKHYEMFYQKCDDIDLWHGHMFFMVIEALMHFSIRHSNRESMISNLKGFVNREKKSIYLSGPSVLDHKMIEDRHGVISAFVREHNCSKMCRRCHEL